MLAAILLVALVGGDFLIDMRVVGACAGANSDQSISACTRIIDELPKGAEDRAIAYLFRGRAFNAKHQFESAIADFSSAISIDPRLAPAFSERATAYAAVHRLDLAITDCTQAITIHPTNAIFRYDCGNAYWHAQQLDKALEAYGGAIRLQPNFALA